VIVDAGVGAAERIARRIDEHELRPSAILLTHGHPDHTWTARALSARYAIPAYLHAADWRWLDDPATGGSLPIVRLGGRLLGAVRWMRPARLEAVEPDVTLPLGLRAIHTPGHTRGSTCFVAGEVCFTGDTVFASGPGHTGYPGGSRPELRRSVGTRLLGLADEVRLLPGHGPEATLERVRPVLQRFAGG
jgi:glyoxylase-like metal-dependent hydrolase (beta-lactamase superfamily II)